MTEHDPELTDEVAVVTGGTRGIGRATTELLAERGATVVANYHSDTAAAERTAQQCSDAPGEVHIRQFDVGDYEAVSAAFEEIETEHGQLTTLVNNAGIMRNSLLLRMEPEAWQRVIRTNLTGTFHCTKAAVRSMLLGDGGSIVCLSSIASQRGWEGQANYAASKAGINGFVQSVAREVSSRDIRINALAAGYTKTDLYEEMGGDEARTHDASSDAEIPVGQPAAPDEIAEVIGFLTSNRASYITGEVIRADGGLLA